MKRLMKLELEGLPPTVNHSYEKRGRRLYKSPECRKYQESVSEKLHKEWGKRKRYSGYVELRITFYTKDRRRWDIDNRVKALQDCLSYGGVIKDDSQIRTLHVERRQGAWTLTVMEVKKDDRAERFSRRTDEMGNPKRTSRLAAETDRREKGSPGALRKSSKE